MQHFSIVRDASGRVTVIDPSTGAREVIDLVSPSGNSLHLEVKAPSELPSQKVCVLAA